MVIQNILYHPEFIARFQKLPAEWQKRVVKTEQLFRINPLHPSLRLHPLHGSLANLWSLSVNKNVRIIFKRMENGDIVFLKVGKHDIYRESR